MNNIRVSLKQKFDVLLMLWLLVWVSIPLMSIYGREMQQVVVQHLSRNQLALLIGTLLLLLSIKAVYWFVRQHQYRKLWHLAWFLPLFIVLPYSMPVVEERIHFIVFGLFGYLSIWVLSWRYAFTVCILMAIGDELLQWVLPNRVGDMRDVLVNLLAVVAGLVFSGLSQESAE